MERESTYAFGAVLKRFRQRRRLTQVQLATALGVHRHTIGSWEQGEYLPDSKGMVLELARLLQLSDQEARQFLEASLTALSPPWYVPFQRNPFFTGREALLETLHTQLSTTPTVALTHSYALHGLGGIGKTQLALEYAYRYALEYTAIFWISAESIEQIISSLVAIAEVLQLPERAETEQQRVVTAVQHWLHRHSGWLLIWDNVEDLEILPRFLPSARESTSLLTTRRQALGTLTQGLEVAPLPAEEALLFLLCRARVLPAAATPEKVAQLAEQWPTEYEAAQELVRLLDGLPLALDQAGAYLEETGCRLSDYLQRYQQQRGALLARRGGPGADHPHSVVTTFSLASQRLEQDQQAAAAVLRVCAYLSAEAIPEELLSEAVPVLGSALERVPGDSTQFDLALAALRRLSLIERQAGLGTFSLHRLVQAVVQEGLSGSERTEWQKRTIHLLNARFPKVTPGVWSQCERLLPHVLTCAEAVPDQVGGEILAEVLHKAADYLRVRAQYEQAEPLYQRARRLYELTLGPAHPDVVMCLFGLGTLYRRQGKDDQAEPVLLHAIRVCEQSVGPEHSLIAAPLGGLAILYYEQGKYRLAELFCQRALRVREQALGPEHPQVADLLNVLAVLSLMQGKYEQAELLCQRVLSIFEQTLGPEHRNMALPLNNLALFYYYQGKYEQAEAVYQQALHISEQALGPTHPDVANPVHGLAELFTAQGKYEQAEALYQRGMQLREHALGTDHPSMAYYLTGLADISVAQGKYEQAEALYQQALHLREQRLGTAHPLVAVPLNGLARLYAEQGKYEQAETLYQRALAIRGQQLGPDHPETAETLAGLAALLWEQHNLTEARRLYQQALTIQVQRLGGEHPHTRKTRSQYDRLAAQLEQMADPGFQPAEGSSK